MQQQMIMVAQETINVDFDPKGAVMSPKGKENMSLIVGLEHCPATGAPVPDVLTSTFIGNLEWAGHGNN